MARINNEIIKFVEEGIFESGKAYIAIRNFEKYLGEAIEDLFENYNWEEYNIKPDFNSFKFSSDPRKYIGNWIAYGINIQLKNDITKFLWFMYNSSATGNIIINGYWLGEKQIEYKDYDKSIIKPRKDNDGIKLEIVLSEKDKVNFSFNEYFTLILDTLVRHSDQLL